jgi:hypothetical protein
MTTITIPINIWYSLADVIQDMGNHHPSFRGTEAGETAYLSLTQRDWIERAEAVTVKHGGVRHGLLPLEGFIETAEKLLGLWPPTGLPVPSEPEVKDGTASCHAP